MAVSDLDIWRQASALMLKHGDQAWTEAVARYFAVEAAEDQDMWRRIAKALADFRWDRPVGKAH